MGLKKRSAGNILKTLILPAAVYLTMTVITKGRFGQSASMLMILRQSVVPILIAMACSFVMLMGMWDFSAGAVVMTAAILGGLAAKTTGGGILVLSVVCITVAVLLSFLTGLLYNFMKVPSIVLTVGLAMIYEAIPRLFSINQVKINIRDNLLSQSPWCFLIIIAGFAIFYILNNYTAFGQDMKAIGANIVVANNAGVNLPRTKLTAFVLSGFFSGLAALLYISNTAMIQAPISFGSIALIFDALMGIFLAFFLEKYSNFSIGLIIGTLSMKMLTSGLVALGLATTIRGITTGLFLLILLIISSNQTVVDQMKQNKRLAKRANELWNRGDIRNHG